MKDTGFSGFWDNRSWGFGMSIITRRDHPGVVSRTSAALALKASDEQQLRQ